MSPRIHDRHSMVDPDGASDDELAEALLEAQRELSQPIPMHRAPDGFLDRIMRRTLQVVEVIVAFLLLRGAWSNKALAAGLAGSTAVLGLGVMTDQLWTADAELPPVQAYAQRDDVNLLLDKLARLGGPEETDTRTELEAPDRPQSGALVVGTGSGAGLDRWLDEDGGVGSTSDESKRQRELEALRWSDSSVDRVITRAMRKVGMSMRGTPGGNDGWRCHEGGRASGDGQRHYRHYFDSESGRTKTVPVRCYRL